MGNSTFIEKLTVAASNPSISVALKEVYNLADDLLYAGEFEVFDAALLALDVKTIRPEIVVGVLTICAPWKQHLKNHPAFFAATHSHFTISFGKERTEKILCGMAFQPTLSGQIEAQLEGTIKKKLMKKLEDNEQGEQMTKTTATYELHLPYFKQGDDIGAEIQHAKKEGSANPNAEGFRNHANTLDGAAHDLRVMAKVAENHELEVHADTHIIEITGPEDVLKEVRLEASGFSPAVGWDEEDEEE